MIKRDRESFYKFLGVIAGEGYFEKRGNNENYYRLAIKTNDSEFSQGIKQLADNIGMPISLIEAEEEYEGEKYTSYIWRTTKKQKDTVLGLKKMINKKSTSWEIPSIGDKEDLFNFTAGLFTAEGTASLGKSGGLKLEIEMECHTLKKLKKALSEVDIVCTCNKNSRKESPTWRLYFSVKHNNLKKFYNKIGKKVMLSHKRNNIRDKLKKQKG